MHCQPLNPEFSRPFPSLPFICWQCPRLMRVSLFPLHTFHMIMRSRYIMESWFRCYDLLQEVTSISNNNLWKQFFASFFLNAFNLIMISNFFVVVDNISRFLYYKVLARTVSTAILLNVFKICSF